MLPLHISLEKKKVVIAGGRKHRSQKAENGDF